MVVLTLRHIEFIPTMWRHCFANVLIESEASHHHACGPPTACPCFRVVPTVIVRPAHLPSCLHTHLFSGEEMRHHVLLPIVTLQRHDIITSAENTSRQIPHRAASPISICRYIRTTYHGRLRAYCLHESCRSFGLGRLSGSPGWVVCFAKDKH